MNNGITAVVRPQTLDEVIGMETNKRIIRYYVQGAKNRGEPLPSFICSGPAGCGKSTIADIIGRESEGKVHKIMGADLKDIDDVFKLAIECRDGDCVFIEESEAIGGGKKGRVVQHYLYEWIENFNMPGSQAFGLTVVPKVCFVLATTDPGRLLPALRSRCKRLDVSYYGIEDLSKIILKAASKLGHDFSNDMDAVRLLAQSSRGMPRIAIMQRLDALLNVMSVDKLSFNLDAVEQFLQIMDIHPFGLEPNDILYCKTVYETMKENGGRPVSLKIIQQTTGLADNLVTEVIEPYLFQAKFISVSARGRVLTPKAYEVLHWTPVAITAEERAHYQQLDKVTLQKMIDDGAAELGVQALMGCFNLRYRDEKDKAAFYAALDELGYTVRRGRNGGIVKKS